MKCLVCISSQVYLDAPLIINCVCVRWKGFVNMDKLDGVGGFRFDEDAARVRNIGTTLPCGAKILPCRLSQIAGIFFFLS